MKSLGEIQAGQTVGRYEFLVPIAQGGMAAVWAARLKGSRGFSKTVAVKTMLPTISDDPHFEQMFLDEAQICSRIRHPNVVEILDLGEQDDLLYLVMEWVDGEPLSSIRRAAAKQEGIPRPIAVKIVADAAAGLHAAHELQDDAGTTLGLVHRDVSPQNILITYSGVVKIVDFGVAKAAGRSAEHTGSGQIKGKPPYMSPEQARGDEVDCRSDVFALGIILYQLTTGKHPFRGETDTITLQNIVSERPIIPPRAYDKEYPKPLEAVVMKALERDREQRYQTARELEAALDRVFPPSVGRVRSDDVGRFVESLLGPQGEERRQALRQAIREADARGGFEVEPSFVGELGARMTSPALRTGSHPVLTVTETGSSTPPSPPPGSRPPLPSSPITQPPGHTPFGTQTPTHPPPKKTLGLLWILGGGFVALACVGAALVLTGGLRSGSGAAPEQGATPAALSDSAEATAASEQAPATSANVADDSDAIDLNDLAVESAEKPKPTAPRPRPTWQPKPTSAPAPVPAPKPAAQPSASATSAKPTTKPGTGFVPPPVTDPGF